MKIKLKKLTLINFKGVKELSIDFKDITNIFGANKAGKTTVFDAFTWLLFGKDSIDREKFNIKNTKFPELNRQDHQVEAVISVDGSDITIKRIYREKWTKKKGTTTPVLTGNEQEFFWNCVPLQAGEFSKKIDELVKEVVFKLISNPLHFNNLPWKSRREFLFRMAGDISDADIAVGNNDFEILLQTLQTKTLEEYKREISVRKTTLKDNLKLIPARIDEVSKSKPEELEWDKIEEEIKVKEHAVTDIDLQISDASKANQALNEAKSKKQNQIHGIKTKLSDIEFSLEKKYKQDFNTKYQEYNSQITSLTNDYNTKAAELNSKELALKSLNDKKQGLDVRKNSLLELFKTTNEREFAADSHSNVCCPNCSHEFNPNDADGAKMEEQKKQFIAAKNKALDEIDEQGKALKQEVADCDDRIKNLESEIKTAIVTVDMAQTELVNFKNTYTPPVIEPFDINLAATGSEEHQKLSAELAELEKPVEENQGSPAANAELIAAKSTLNQELDALKKLLHRKQTIEKCNKRIQELKEEEAKLSQQLADLEGAEFTINDFNKAKIELVESRINGKFQYVKFKMYDYTIEGNPVETCETMLDGVPFSDLNTAGKIWAGLDIINTLSKHYGVSAPVFLDNRESVTEIPFTESQIINLFVSPADAALRVE